jgi:hypothetical protein
MSFEQAVPTLAPDHGEADLGTNPNLPWQGIGTADIAAAGYERYWNVSESDDWNFNGKPDLKRIAVIVRWPLGGGFFRRIVLFTTKLNPAESVQ